MNKIEIIFLRSTKNVKRTIKPELKITDNKNLKTGKKEKKIIFFKMPKKKVLKKREKN
jgi:hypothetical protein